MEAVGKLKEKKSQLFYLPGDQLLTQTNATNFLGV